MAEAVSCTAAPAVNLNWRERNEEVRIACSSSGGLRGFRDRPTAPASIPDGNTAAMEDMMAAKTAVDAFKKGMEEYMTCERMASKIESAQKELVKVADHFNAQVRAFKAKG